jgi:nucleoside-diphosphate-sugar epimerase
MRVLVTGHLGFIGPIMVTTLKEAGHHVTGLDVGYFGDCKVNGRTVPTPDREIIKDVRDVEAQDFDGIDAVVHLAALSNDPMGALKPELTYDINLNASARVAALAKAAGVGRFVFASSCSIYGAADGASQALDETAPFNPVSAYAVSKVKTEEALNALADDGFSPVYLRNATAYGVSGRTRLDLVLNNLMAFAHATGEIRVMSDGSPWRPLVHIEDISLAARCAIEAPRDTVHNQAFNIGRSDANYQVRDIAEVVKTVVPSATLVITGETGGDPRSYRVDFTKALTQLEGFKPKWTLLDGAHELDRWIKDGGLEGSAFDSRRFIRLKQLRHLMDTHAVDDELRAVAALV